MLNTNEVTFYRLLRMCTISCRLLKIAFLTHIPYKNICLYKVPSWLTEYDAKRMFIFYKRMSNDGKLYDDWDSLEGPPAEPGKKSTAKESQRKFLLYTSTVRVVSIQKAIVSKEATSWGDHYNFFLPHHNFPDNTKHFFQGWEAPRKSWAGVTS